MRERRHFSRSLLAKDLIRCVLRLGGASMTRRRSSRSRFGNQQEGVMRTRRAFTAVSSMTRLVMIE
jgi:hypothetical protein